MIAALTAVVLARRYSRNSGHTSADTERNTSGYSSCTMAAARRSCRVDVGVQKTADHGLDAGGFALPDAWRTARSSGSSTLPWASSRSRCQNSSDVVLGVGLVRCTS